MWGENSGLNFFQELLNISHRNEYVIQPEPMSEVGFASTFISLIAVWRGLKNNRITSPSCGA